jgi:hypothetical protein
MEARFVSDFSQVLELCFPADPGGEQTLSKGPVPRAS